MEEVVKNIISFNNISGLSWMEVYKEVLKTLNIDKINDNNLLRNTVKELTRLGYDIYDKPFRLEKYK